MKQGIHPEYVEATVHCSCGETFVTRATKPEIRIEICSKCHPFYSGKQKLVDTGGRVQRFQTKYGDYKAPEKKAAASADAAVAEKPAEPTKSAKAARAKKTEEATTTEAPAAAEATATADENVQVDAVSEAPAPEEPTTDAVEPAEEPAAE